MNVNVISREIAQRPLEGQKEVLDFVDFLKSKFKIVKPISVKGKLSDEPFIGMWGDNEKMKDSTTWIREARASEWGS